MDLDPRLASSSHSLTRLRLSDLRLHDDRRFPWLVLVPLRAGLADVDDLSDADLKSLIQDVSDASRALKAACAHLRLPCDKINVAAIGNIVRQLHVHVVARHRHDTAWPQPVWGWGRPEPYAEDTRETIAQAVLDALAACPRP